MTARSEPAAPEAEYEHEPVPIGARQSLASVSLVWLGFPMVLTMALIGSLVVEGLGFQEGVTAIVLGNLVLFVYVGALSLLAQKRGLNFALLASTTLGRKGYVVASGLLSAIVLGWFTVQTGLTAVSLNGAFGWPLLWFGLLVSFLALSTHQLALRVGSVLGLVPALITVVIDLYRD